MTFAEKIVDMLKNNSTASALDLAEKQVIAETLKDPISKRRYAAAKKVLDDEKKINSLAGVWFDEDGRQCFTDSTVAFRLIIPIKSLPERDNPAIHPNINNLFDRDKEPAEVLQEEDVKKYIAHGRLYKKIFYKTEDAREKIGEDVLRIAGVYLSAHLFGTALQILGSAPVMIYPSAALKGRAVYLRCTNGEAVIAGMDLGEEGGE